ncbi:MAG: DUF1858 domain-containing protein [Lachnospiraceae bacterium]|nr:DUF1858 domain-containing protein [Lachnospiraceae bacterium]
MDKQYVSGKTPISEIIAEYPEAVEVLMAIGMHCIGCFASSMESLEDACMVHELDAEQIVEAVNVVIKERRKPAEVA